MNCSRRTWMKGMLAASAGLAYSDAPPETSPRRLVLMAGDKSHGFGEHEHGAGCELLAARLRGFPGLEVILARGKWPEDPEIIRSAHAVAFYCDGDGRHLLNGHEAELKERPDLGLGFIHYATAPPAGPAFDRILERTGGVYEQHWSVNPFWTADFTAFPPHPSARGLLPFTIEDEWYYHMRFIQEPDPGLQRVLLALPPPESLNRRDGPHSGNPAVRRAVLEQREIQAVSWVRESAGGGRGFGFTGGHWHWNWAHPGFRRHVLNALVWLTGLEVPEEGVASPQPSWEEIMEPLGRAPAGFDAASLRASCAKWNALADGSAIPGQ